MKPIHLLYCLLIICCSCNQAVQQSEYFDVIINSEYENTYNSKGQLDSIRITSRQQMYQLDRPLSLELRISKHKYTYRNDSLYSICETNVLDKDITTTTYFNATSEETVSIWNNKDTINYSLRQYSDNRKERLVYERVIRRASGEPIIHFTISDNYEEWSFYDNECMTKTIRHDFNNSQTEETYYFHDIPYKEALLKVPESSNPQIIVCHTSTHINDTIVEKSLTNGEFSQITKSYNDHGKEVVYTYNAGGHEALYIQYKEKDMDISVEKTSFLGNSTDSTYTRNGKTMREAKISDTSKRLVTYEYDSLGHVTKRVEKIKFFE